MMVRTWVLVGIVVIVVASLAGARPARATQQATPSPTAGGLACAAAPQPVDEVVALIFGPEGTPAVAMAAPSPVSSEADLPPGEPSDPETAAAVDAVVQTWLACLVAGQEARALGLMSDDLDRVAAPRLFEAISGGPEALRIGLEADLAATPAAAPGDSSVTTAPGREVRMLADGRVGGIWAVGGNAAFVVVERADGGWLVDEVVDVLEAATPAAGTPAA